MNWDNPQYVGYWIVPHVILNQQGFWNTAQVKCRSAGMGPICGTHGEQPSNPTRTVVILVTNKWIILGSLGIDPYLGRRKVKGITSKSPS